MAKRRVNKNLVAFVTVAGVVLAVIVVGIAAYNASRRDPAAIALKAKAQEASDARRAILLYQRAFAVDKEATYLLDAARVAREMGDLNTMFGLLNLAYAQSPGDEAVLNALLVRYWEIRYFHMGQWKDVQERATKLCGKEPENLLALASLAEALVWLEDDDAIEDDRDSIGQALPWLSLAGASPADLADQILNRAAEIDPTSSHVALVRAKQSQMRAGQRVREAFQRGKRSELEGIEEQTNADQLGYLRPALEAHPDDIPLRVACAQVLARGKQWTASREVLEAGIEAQTEDPDLHYELARVHLGEVRQRMSGARVAAQAAAGAISSAEDLALIEEAVLAVIDQTLVAEGLRYVNRAIELEPALYDAYMLRTDLQRLGWMGDGSWQADATARQKEILESFAVALDATVGLESFRAVLARYRLERLRLITAGFESALSFYRSASDQTTRPQAVTYMRKFLQEAQTQYAERPQASLMEGYLAIIDKDQRLGIAAFSRAEEDAERVAGEAAPLARLAREELSKLYRVRGELGLALDYTDEVIKDYTRQQVGSPRWVYLQRIEVLLSLERASAALDQVESAMILWPDWALLKAARARALTALDRTDEARRVLEDVPDDPRYLFERARFAALNEDYDTAVTLFGQVLEFNPEDVASLDRYLRVLIAAQRLDQAQQFIRERLELTTSEQARRLLQSFDLLLSESDLEVRRQKRLEMIAAIPDEFERAYDYFSFWRIQGESEQAAEYLDEMERLKAGDVTVQRLQFDMALHMNNCERAQRYAVLLAQADADRMGGAMFRGRWELSCGDAQRALTEFETAAQRFPRDPELKTHIARALMRLAPPRYEQAIQTLTEACAADPQSFDAQRLLYACYEVTGRRSEPAAVRALEAAVKRAGQLRIEDEYIDEHAQLLDEEKDPQQGIANREKLREDDPQDVGNLLRLAELYKKVGDAAEQLGSQAESERNQGLARECLLAAAEAEPANSNVARFAARFFVARNDQAAGEALLGRYLEAQDGLGEIVARGLLGRFYEALADGETAIVREMVTDGEKDTVYGPHLAARIDLRAKALSAYQQAQERVAGAMAGAPEEERRRAVVVSASELAGYHRRLREWAEMIAAYRVMLDGLSPEDVASSQMVRLRIISGLRSLQRLGEARDELDAFRKQFPNNPQGMVPEAELLIASNELAPAYELLSRVLTDDPDHVWSLYMRARLDIRRQRYTEARDDLLRAKDLAPRAFDLNHRYELARLYELMHKPELAEAELREICELDRGGDRGAELRLIAQLKRTDQIEEAQEFVNQLVALSPNQWRWSYELGKLLVEREEHSAAVRPLRRAVELTGYKNPKVIEDLLQALVRGGRSREACREYEDLLPKMVELRLDPRLITPSIKTYAAEAYLVEGRRDVATRLLEQALSEANPGGVHVARLVAHRAQALLGLEDARALLQGVLDRTSEVEAELPLRIMLLELVMSERDSTRQAGALEQIEAIISDIPQGSAGAALHVEALLVQALALSAAGQSERALAAYEQALALQPGDLRVLNNLAYMLADELSRPAEALPYARKLHQVAAGGNAAALDTVGWVYFRNGLVDQALPVFLEAVRIDPNRLAVRHHLGHVYADNGRKADAEREFRRVLALAREQQDAEYIQKAEQALERLR